MVKIIHKNTEEGKQMISDILSRSQLETEGVAEVVNQIIKGIKENKDNALFAYIEKYDHVKLTPETIRVTKEEIEMAYNETDSALIAVIQKSAERIRTFHTKQKQNSWLEPDASGEILGQMIRPLSRVGVYVPGGKAAYPSSVLMNVIPAQIAGVKEIIMVTPPQADGSVSAATIVAANEAGVTEIYKVGGAQAIASLAFGTETIPHVDKITGPGNIYVAMAKRAVYGYVNIDSIAGPSEILIIADETSNPVFVAADLLSQAEHDELASAICVTTSEELARQIAEETEKQGMRLERKGILEKSLRSFGAVIVVDTLEEAAELSNQIAPEHLELCVAKPFELLCAIQNAGAVFLGNYTPEPLGDYMAGPNHVLPTGGTARFYSPLSVDDFVKKSSVLSFSKKAMKAIGDDVIKFANAEGLTGHANAIRVRLENRTEELL